MPNNANRNLILICVAVAAGLVAFWWQSSTNMESGSTFVESPTPAGNLLPASASSTAKVDALEPQASNQSEPVSPRVSSPIIATQNSALIPNRTASPTEAVPASPRKQLSAEAGLVTAGGISVKAIQALMQDDDFDNRIERLSEQSLHEPLAIDLTALHASAAADASQNVTGVEVKRMACGLQICMAALSAPSQDAFQKWTAWFMSNPSVQVRSVSTGTSMLGDGSTEYRFFFSTDSSVNRVFMGPGQ